MTRFDQSVAERFRIEKARSLELLRKESAHTEWMNECVPEMLSYGKDQDVAVAACLNMWRQAWEENHPDGADDPGPDRPEAKQLRHARELLKAWDEADHPRVPAGSPDGGQFGEGGGASSSKPSGGKGKKGKAKKEDFDKAGIKLDMVSSSVEPFIEKWNETVGEDPAEFKKGFMGGLDGPMEISGSGARINIEGEIKGTGVNEGFTAGKFTRMIDLENKVADSAYFKLDKSMTGSDMGKSLLAGNVETYQELGVEKVRVYANIDVGGYAWAKYGYVPTYSAWADLRGKLQRKLAGGGSGSSADHGTNVVVADDWDQLPSSVQDDVRDRWMSESYDEFLQSEKQNWLESGQALGDAKNALAYLYQNQYNDIPAWANEAFDKSREDRKDAELPDFPYTNKQLFDAIELTYSDDTGDGSGNPDITFDDDKLREPQGVDPNQPDLPGIPPQDLSQYLTKSMRKELETDLIKAFNQKANEDSYDIEPPNYLADQVSEYQGEYWDSMSDRDKLQHANNYEMAYVPIERDEEDAPQLDLPKTETDPLLEAARSDDPKSIWKIADHPRGKSLLLGTSWNGVLNLKDKDTMARFNAYVGKRKSSAAAAA